jgi:hypothetical protein
MSRNHDASGDRPEAVASRFSELAAALRLDGATEPAPGLDRAAVVALASELAAVELPPLQLGRTRKTRARHWLGTPQLWAAAAAIALMVAAGVLTTLRSTEPRYRIKGATSVRVYWERAGQVHELQPNTALANGDRVMVDVLASEAATAYWGVFDRRGRLLGDWDAVERSGVRLEPGRRQTSSTSLQLVGANDGERAVVFVCPAASPLSAPRFAGLEAKLRDAVATGRAELDLATCRVQVFSLR